MDVFGYDLEILRSFPDLQAAVVHARGVHPNPSETKFEDEYLVAQQEVKDSLLEAALSEIPSIGAWRRVFRGFGVKPTQYRSAAEALLRRLQKHAQIPTIHPLVDLANWVSIRFCLPVAAFDLRSIQVPLTVAFSSGTEWFTPLHDSEPVHPEPGEVVFVDEKDVVHARRWCWRQSKQSASSPQTTEVLFTIEGHHQNAHEDVLEAQELFIVLFQRYFIGTLNTGTLNSERPRFII